MPWESQNTFARGEVIHVRSYLDTHHAGHMELRACPLGRASTQDCFEDYPLTFVEDTLYNMPADPAHPERGYYGLEVNLEGSRNLRCCFSYPIMCLATRFYCR